MGVTNDEYILVRGNKKDLEKVAKFFKKVLKKDGDYKHFVDCVGKVGGGMNGKYSLVVVPTGFNGGWREDTLNALQEKINKLKHKAEQYNLESKIAQKELGAGHLKYRWPISMSIIRFSDWGNFYINDEEQTFEFFQKKQPDGLSEK